MGKKAVKFGGTSLCDAAQMKKAAEIVRSDTERSVVVVSAPGKRTPKDEKMTDLLLRMDKTDSFSEREAVFAVICERLNDITEKLGLTLDFSNEFDMILREFHGDALISRGEYFCAKIFAAYLGFHFLDAADVIFFREDGAVDEEKTRYVLGRAIETYQTVVIPGFYGSLPNGEIHIFPRGGSDITGAIAADAANADVYENFTDVCGLLLADPKIVENPKTVPAVSYRELRRLSSMGATVLHADSILPLYQSKIPIVIRNTNAPKGDCTWILPQKEKCAVSGIVGQKGYTLFSVSRTRIGEDIFAFRELLALFGEYTSSVYSTPRTVDACGILVRSEDISDVKETIIRRIYHDFHGDNVILTEELALLSVISECSASQNAATLLRVMEDMGAYPILLDGGADHLGITVGFRSCYLEELIRRLYAKFEKEIF